MSPLINSSLPTEDHSSPLKEWLIFKLLVYMGCGYIVLTDSFKNLLRKF